MADRMARMRDLTDRKAATTGQKPPEDWRKKALYKLGSPGNTSEAAQERTSSSSDRDAGNVLPNRRERLREQRWKENRSDRGVAAASSNSPGRWLQSRGSEAKFKHDANSKTRQLGELKGDTDDNQARVIYDPDWRPSLEGLNNGTEWYVGSRPPGETEEQ